MLGLFLPIAFDFFEDTAECDRSLGQLLSSSGMSDQDVLFNYGVSDFVDIVVIDNWNYYTGITH